MIKTYITTFLCILMAGAQLVQAQDSMDDILADLDTASESSAPEAVVETTPAGAVDVAPAAVDSSAEVVSSGETPSGTVEGSDLFDRGCAYFKAGDFDQAEAAFEAMLVIDPYDARAMKYLQRTAKRIGSLEQRKLLPTRAQAITAVAEAWNQEPKVKVVVKDPATTPVVGPDDLAIQQMEARIKALMIPSLDFREANIMDVVLFLSETCRRLDSNGKGVNMLLLGMGDSYDTEGNSITISIRDMSLYDALQYIAEMAKLKIEVQSNAIAIMPVTYAPAKAMVVRSYDVSPDVGADLESASGSDAGGGEDDLFGDSSAAEPSAGPADVTGFFSIIEFPGGASAVYQPRFQKLFVKNTPNNLEALEAILSDMEDKATARRSQQVEIEAKFVEFNEGALEEIGFDWTAYGSGTVGGFGLKDGTYFNPINGFNDPRKPQDSLGSEHVQPVYVPSTTPTPIYLDPVSGYEVIGGNGQNIFGSGQRSNEGAFSEVVSGIVSSMGGPVPAMVFGNGDVDLRITAMEQEGTADVLSAPKVTTKSGNEAIIRIVEVHRYPQDYDVETGQRTAPVVKPQDWEDFDLGVSLKVTPVVDSDSNTIDLDLMPEITKFKGFDLYVVGYNAYDAGGNNDFAPGGDGSTLFAKMPFFEKRSVQTQVTIADGNTVLMGGLVDERTETFRDQIPFLGDIPYLGRLFRTEGSRNSKKNLVIYVKATQVDDHGMTQADREMARQVTAN
ncbi:MAG: hypothetical protein KAU94_04530 [Verrucomicrobia bacterium]|nr:hypothetical protein [Verrucomicrobiota bacterium]